MQNILVQGFDAVQAAERESLYVDHHCDSIKRQLVDKYKELLFTTVTTKYKPFEITTLGDLAKKLLSRESMINAYRLSDCINKKAEYNPYSLLYELPNEYGKAIMAVSRDTISDIWFNINPKKLGYDEPEMRERYEELDNETAKKCDKYKMMLLKKLKKQIGKPVCYTWYTQYTGVFDAKDGTSVKEYLNHFLDGWTYSYATMLSDAIGVKTKVSGDDTLYGWEDDVSIGSFAINSKGNVVEAWYCIDIDMLW